MSSTDNIFYWVITGDERAYGPYEDYAGAYQFGTTNLGFEGWTIACTHKSGESI